MTTVPPTPASPRRRLRRGEGALLASDILDAADALLVAGGDEDSVSIRAIAAAVGVSPPSIYLHFPDKTSLLFAVCERHFAALDAAMEAAEASVDDPIEALRERGRAYVRFGIDNPEHYRILFMGAPWAAPATWSDDRLSASAAFNHQVDAVARCVDAGVFPGLDPVLGAMGLWAAAHGVASLVISKPDFPWPPLEVLVDHVLDAHGSGLAAMSAAGGSCAISPPGGRPPPR